MLRLRTRDFVIFSPSFCRDYFTLFGRLRNDGLLPSSASAYYSAALKYCARLRLRSFLEFFQWAKPQLKQGTTQVGNLKNGPLYMLSANASSNFIDLMSSIKFSAAKNVLLF